VREQWKYRLAKWQADKAAADAREAAAEAGAEIIDEAVRTEKYGDGLDGPGPA
jgi:hypothetical protein